MESQELRPRRTQHCHDGPGSHIFCWAYKCFRNKYLLGSILISVSVQKLHVKALEEVKTPDYKRTASGQAYPSAGVTRRVSSPKPCSGALYFAAGGRKRNRWLDIFARVLYSDTTAWFGMGLYTWTYGWENLETFALEKLRGSRVLTSEDAPGYFVT